MAETPLLYQHKLERMQHRLTIIIPAYNEAATIGQILQRVMSAPLPGGMSRQLIVVDDGSTDGTAEAVNAFAQAQTGEILLLSHRTNRGKGAAIRTALRHTHGNFALIQDADLEYDPRDYQRLLQPLVEGVADVVYGSRFVGGQPHRVLYFWHFLGNRFLTLLSNLLTGLNLTDMETCFKAFRTETLNEMTLRENRFGFEPEVTAKAAAIPKIRFYEVGIAYYGRTYEEGKKVNWKDGLRAVYCIFRYNKWF